VELNEVFGWTWIVAGFLSGTLLGLRFHRDDWLGGYASLRRRLIRLGHISFLGLGILNILFASSAARLALPPALLGVASWAMIVGAVTMPACCALMAWKRSWHAAFAVPVTSLVLGAALVVAGALGR
jgi:hypothetical protein